MKKAVIVEALRTPIGKRGQSLASMPAEKLGAKVIEETIKRTKIDPNEVEEVIFGNILNFNINNIARISWLEAGYPINVPATVINKRCASSLSALVLGKMMIETNNADIVLTGGVESYSQNPIMVKRSEKPYPNTLEVLKTIQSPDFIGNISLLETAENVAEKYNVTREEADYFAYQSHMLASDAWEKKLFYDQIIPIEISTKEGDVNFYWDESIRADTNLDALSKLRPVVKANGIVTAGNSSPMNDGASAVMIMSEEKAKSMGLEPLVEVKEFAAAGCDPNHMGMGPVYSTNKLLKKTGYKMDDFDLIELNEAFATQSIACLKEMDLYNPKDMKRINVNGGAIAIGHPNSASGGILVARLAYELRRRNLRRGLITFCIGGGQGFSLVLENYCI